jgi:hypothetical protein
VSGNTSTRSGGIIRPQRWHGRVSHRRFHPPSNLLVSRGARRKPPPSGDWRRFAIQEG